MDLATLGDNLSNEPVLKVIYCTSRLLQTDRDPDITTRQDVYLRALATADRVTILYGQFKLRYKRGARQPTRNCTCCSDPASPSCSCCSGVTAGIRAFEEKGSDVQLAVQLVKHAFLDSYDRAFIISNDSDLQPAVNVVREISNKVVCIVNPDRNAVRNSLQGTQRKRLTDQILSQSQFPNPIRLDNGSTIHMPLSWKK